MIWRWLYTFAASKLLDCSLMTGYYHATLSYDDKPYFPLCGCYHLAIIYTRASARLSQLLVLSTAFVFTDVLRTRLCVAAFEST